MTAETEIERLIRERDEARVAAREWETRHDRLADRLATIFAILDADVIGAATADPTPQTDTTDG
jgi:hypothetical protein